MKFFFLTALFTVSTAAFAQNFKCEEFISARSLQIAVGAHAGEKYVISVKGEGKNEMVTIRKGSQSAKSAVRAEFSSSDDIMREYGVSSEKFGEDFTIQVFDQKKGGKAVSLEDSENFWSDCR